MRNYILVFISFLLIGFSYFNQRNKYITHRDVINFYANHFYPNIEFNADTIRIGYVNGTDSNIVGNFEFQNAGSGNLIIKDVVPACGCTAVRWTKQTLKHNMRGIMRFSIDTKQIDTGWFEKDIVIHTNGYFTKKIITIVGHFSKG